MCYQQCVDFLPCNHTFWGEISPCSTYAKECKRRPFFQKMIGWAPKHCSPMLTRTTDPNMCPRCQKKRLKEQFARVHTGRADLNRARQALNNGTNYLQDAETKDRIQKGNITWDLTTARGSTDFRRDRGRRHQGHVRFHLPQEDTGPKSSTTSGQMTGLPRADVDRRLVGSQRQGQSDRQPPLVAPATVPFQASCDEQQCRMQGPRVPPKAHRREAANSSAYPPPPPGRAMMHREAATYLSKPLPPLPLNIKRKPVPAMESPARQAEQKHSFRTSSKDPSHPSSHYERSSKNRQDNERHGRSCPPEPLKLPTRDRRTKGATHEPPPEPLKPPTRDRRAKEATHEPRGKPSSNERRGHGHGHSRGDRDREPHRPTKSSGAAPPPKVHRTPTGSRFVEHFSSDEDIRRGHPAPTPTMRASATAPSIGRRVPPPTTFDDERLARAGRHGGRPQGATDDGKDKGKRSRADKPAGVKLKESDRKSARTWLRHLRPPSPVETDLSFTCRDARKVEGRR